MNNKFYADILSQETRKQEEKSRAKRNTHTYIHDRREKDLQVRRG